MERFVDLLAAPPPPPSGDHHVMTPDPNGRGGRSDIREGGDYKGGGG